MNNLKTKTMKKKEILKCALNLTKAELKIFLFFCKNNESEYLSEEVARELKLNLSTVQRAVKKLYLLEVLKLRQKNRDAGGYVYIYIVVPKEQYNEIIRSVIVKWYTKAYGYFI